MWKATEIAPNHKGRKTRGCATAMETQSLERPPTKARSPLSRGKQYGTKLTETLHESQMLNNSSIQWVCETHNSATNSQISKILHIEPGKFRLVLAAVAKGRPVRVQGVK